MRNVLANELTLQAKDRDELVLLSGVIENLMFDNYKKVAPNKLINCA